MCGIVAVVAPGRTFRGETLDAMRDTLAHRGPDGAASWMDDTGEGQIGFGHRRLAIIDLTDGGRQPMFSVDGRTVLVHNGEIYNYVELRAELRALGHVFRTATDTEVLLAAYREWGEGCLQRLNGMFAFMVWDADRQHLFAARDRFGEKPLFYAQPAGGGIVIASEIKALLRHPGVAAAPDEEAVARYTGGLLDDYGEATMFRGVRRLPPAHAIVVDALGAIVRRWRWWTPQHAAGPDAFDAGRSAERFRELLDQSVRLRLRADVPIGTSLSGGLDSSMLVGLLMRVRREEAPMLTQNAFSARFDDDPTVSEGSHIDRVAERSGVRAFAVSPHPLELASESEALHWHQEEPFLSASIYLQWCVMRLAREHATTVLLDGQGADELLGGYQAYFRLRQVDLLERWRLATLVRETRWFNRRLRAAASEYADSARRFDSEVALSFGILLRAAIRRPPPPAGPYDDGVPRATRGARLRRRLAEDLQFESLPQLLRYADRNAMAFGRETRFPYLDYALVDWCLTLPDEAYVDAGWQKRILRTAAEGLVPREIQWRADKVGYAAPLDRWLRGPLREWARERLFDSSLAGVDGYDRAAVEVMWNEHENGTDRAWALWRWVTLAEWLSLFERRVWTARPPAVLARTAGR